jgi:FkbM family methyltransferase
MTTRRQRAVAAVTRRYPLYSGCGTLANHRLIRWIAGPGVDLASGKVFGGLRVAAPLEDYVGRAVFYSGELDRKITWVCSRVVRPGDTVLDIGANLGLVTFVLSSLVGTRGRVHSFEPIPEMQSLIERALAWNHTENVQLHRMALGAETGQLPLSIPRGHAGSASFVAARHHPESDVIYVPVRTLSDVMARHEQRPVRLVKIDVEGFEPEVLAGAREFFENSPPDIILFELNDFDGDARESPTVRWLAERGYGFFSIPLCVFRMRLLPYSLTEPGPAHGGHDFLAARIGPIYDEVSKLVRAT